MSVANTPRMLSPYYDDKTVMEMSMTNKVLQHTLAERTAEIERLKKQGVEMSGRFSRATKYVEESTVIHSVLELALDTIVKLLSDVMDHVLRQQGAEMLLSSTGLKCREDALKASLMSVEKQREDQAKRIVVFEEEIQRLKKEIEDRDAEYQNLVRNFKLLEEMDRRWHVKVCLEKGGLFKEEECNHYMKWLAPFSQPVDLNHQPIPDELVDVCGVGLKLSNTAPFEILGCHPDTRQANGLPFIPWQGDVLLAVDGVSVERLTKEDVAGLICGPRGSVVVVKVLRQFSYMTELKSKELKLVRKELKERVEMIKARAPPKLVLNGKGHGKRKYEHYFPPTGNTRIGDKEVWKSLLLRGKPLPDNTDPNVFELEGHILHQPTYIQDGDFKTCTVWDVETGDVYYRGPPGPPLTEEDVIEFKQEQERREQEEREQVEHFLQMEIETKAKIEFMAKKQAEAILESEREKQVRESLVKEAINKLEEEERILLSQRSSNAAEAEAAVQAEAASSDNHCSNSQGGDNISAPSSHPAHGCSEEKQAETASQDLDNEEVKDEIQVFREAQVSPPPRPHAL
eukprot:760065-Hanusia_phi.AAC.1